MPITNTMIDQEYYAHCHKLIKALLGHYGQQFFIGKRILDLGAHKGVIAGALQRLGSNVVCVDARQEHLDHLIAQFPGLQTVRANLEYEFPFENEKFDLVLSLGILGHIKNWDRHIHNILSVSENIVLETEVLDSGNSSLELEIYEDRNVKDLSFSGEASIVSVAAIQKQLKDEGVSFKRLDKKYLNSAGFIYDWRETNTNSERTGQRRLWIIRQNTILKRIFESTRQVKEYKPNMPFVKPQSSTSIYTTPANEIRRSPEIRKIFGPTKKQLPGSSIHTIGAKYFTDIKTAKIAVVINGHLRTFEKTYKSFVKNILYDNTNNVDVFIHTWETLGAQPSRGREHDIGYDTISTKSKTSEIENIFRPKTIIIDSYDIKNIILDYTKMAKLTQAEYKGFYGDNLNDYCSMLYSMNQSIMLMNNYEKINNIKYDIVIKYRPDILSVQKVDITNYAYTDNVVYTPNIATYYTNGMNDQMAIGNGEVMKSYMSIYTKIIQYLNGHVINPLRPETLMRYHLTKNNIHITPINWTYYILRCTGGYLVPQGANMALKDDVRKIMPFI